AELGLVRTHVAERGPGRLFHDLADLTGEHEILVLAVDHGGFHREDVATVLAHRDTGDRADLVFLFGQTVVEALRPEVFGQPLDGDLDLVGLAFGDGARDLPADRADLALETAD